VSNEDVYFLNSLPFNELSREELLKWFNVYFPYTVFWRTKDDRCLSISECSNLHIYNIIQQRIRHFGLYNFNCDNQDNQDEDYWSWAPFDAGEYFAD
jgi:hypothetical protein